MEYLVIGIFALGASLLSFYSGFGLGTLLMPIIALFFPLPIAIGLTAIVHLVHNLFKTSLLFEFIEWKIAWRFGGAAIIASLIGALLLKELSLLPPLKRVPWGEVTLLHLLVGLLLILFALFEIVPKRKVPLRNLYVGGAISGFFGGLTGNQGPFRSLFLTHQSKSKESFIATGSIIATIVDITRLFIYTISFQTLARQIAPTLMLTSVASSIFGILLGSYFLPRISMQFIKRLVIVLLFILGALLAVGII